MKETNLVRHTHTVGSGLTPEQVARIKEAEKYPIVYDEDCPELTDEQLAQFQPVHFATREERDRAMLEAERAKAGADRVEGHIPALISFICF